MKRYLAIPLLAAISAASFVAGYSLATPATPPVLLMPLTLTVHTLDGVRVVHATYSDVAFGTAADGSALAVEYRSDRIFCDGFEGFLECLKILP